MKSVRIVLRFGSVVFGLSALALVITPSLFLELLGLAPTSALDWSMRMTGITLVALAGNMLAHSLHGTEKSVLFAGWVMMFSATALGVLTLMIPTNITWFTAAYAAVGFGFAASYAIALLRK